MTATTVMTTDALDAAVSAAAVGAATQAERAALESDPVAWAVALRRLLAATERDLAQVRRMTGPERDQVVADFEEEHRSLAQALTRLTGEVTTLPSPSTGTSPEASTRAGRPSHQTAAPHQAAASASHQTVAADPEAGAETGPARLQLSWDAGRVVAWGGSRDAGAMSAAELQVLLAAAGAPASAWSGHTSVILPDGTRADAVASPLRAVLGWLAALGGTPSGDDRLGASARWLGQVALWAVELVAHGHMVPTLTPLSRRTGGRSACSVRWVPALVESDRLARLAASAPGAVSAFDHDQGGTFTERVLGGVIDVICADAAGRIDRPAVPPRPRTSVQTAEAFLAHLDGAPFEPAPQPAADLAGRLERWSRPATHAAHARLIVQLDAPDTGGAWPLAVLAAGTGLGLTPVEIALVNAPAARRAEIADHLARLERMLPVLRRAGGRRRGEVLLSQDEAWGLMTETGRRLSAAGFDVRVPALSRRKPKPVLRLVADASKPSVVGAHQLASVRWSALFDDVELTAADIARLAAEARPLVQAGGRWVALDHADLAAAAAALAERAGTVEMTGGAMLRHALGLEGSPLSGGVRVDGNGWASELLRRAESTSGQPVPAPEGFRGSLRSYQEEALAWLEFLDASGLGGCLALDMGLGKTPTVLARVLAARAEHPTLVIAPPAVVGNWAAEAARFTPSLRVVVHHGSDRSSAGELAGMAAGADVVLTTYGTAVRDVEALAAVAWDRVVIDEAQAIKNPASETAQQLRRIPARTRLALTGTPIENGLGDLWSILDFTNPGLVGSRPQFITHLSGKSDGDAPAAEVALRALNGLLVFRRTKAEPAIAAELPERIDELDHCAMTPEQIGLYQAVLDRLVAGDSDGHHSRGEILAAITALKQICNHPAAYRAEGTTLADRSGEAGPVGGDRRRRVRGRGAGAHLHPLRHVGPPPGHLPDRADRCADRLLRRLAEPPGARPPGRRLPDRDGRPAPWSCRSRPAAPAST